MGWRASDEPRSLGDLVATIKADPERHGAIVRIDLEWLAIRSGSELSVELDTDGRVERVGESRSWAD